MQRTPRTLVFGLSLVILTLVRLTSSWAADFSAIWDGGNGNWGDPLHWSTNPNFPNNSKAGTYDATISSGSVTLDRNITIQRLFLSGSVFNHGSLIGTSELTLNEGLTWTEGSIGSIFSRPPLIWKRVRPRL